MSESPGFNPPSDCGKPDDTGKRVHLWEVAKAAPDPHHQGYVILDGALLNLEGKFNKLLVAKDRITGIECPKVLDKGPVNFWKSAWDEANQAFKLAKPDILVGINSSQGRTQDQFHIHLTALKRDVRTQLDHQNNQKGVSDWNGNLVELGPSVKPDNKTYVYRVAHVDNLDVNPFQLLNDYVATQTDPKTKLKYNDRFAQSLAIVAGTNGKGFYLIATQGAPDPNIGQPEHLPELHRNGNWGGKTAEGLMDRHWK